jgi:hypothetical protein
MNSRWPAVLCVFVSLSLFSTGCGTNKPSGVPAPAPATQSSGTIPEPLPIAEWTKVTDAGSRADFALPGQAKTSRREGDAEGTRPNSRAYLVEVSPGFTVSVGFADARTADYSAAGLDLFADGIATNLTAEGITDVVVKNRKPGTLKRLPVLDFEIHFTSVNGKTVIIFTRVIGKQTQAMLLQSNASVAPSEAPAKTKLVERYQQQLVASVELSELW